MSRMGRLLLGTMLLILGLATLGLKAWLELSGPYVEALPPYPFCREAGTALEEDRVAQALELARVGGCGEELASAQERWGSVSANFGRCVGGVWTGRGEGAAGVSCSVVSDLVVFGDVRDLTRQGLRWRAGEDVDPVLIALSTAGLVLTFAPQVGAGNDLLKVARRTGSLSDELARGVVTLVRRGEWQALANLLGNAGRISRRLGPEGTRAMAYADTPEELRRLARFVEGAEEPMLALSWAGKSATRIDDPTLYRVALSRGPDGLDLAARRGAGALLSTKPFVIFLTKTLYRQAEALPVAAIAIATWLLTKLSWPAALIAAAVLVLLGVFVLFRPRRRRRGFGTA